MWKANNLPIDKHCFFGADKGHSKGFYATLNVNTKSDDKREDIEANLSDAATHLGLTRDRLHLLNQGVSSVVEYVENPSWDEMWADGVVTDKPNIALCIRTADCAPVLLADYKNGIIGAAHAGWRGAFGGVIENTVKLMLQKGADIENITAAVGPCIGQESYEVDESFYTQFVAYSSDFAKYFKTGNVGHYWFDLEGFCVDKLKNCGIKNIECSGIDTYKETQKYYSFRRFTHQNLVKKPKCFPTELSAIVL